MTYGFRPENWPDFRYELARRDIEVADIERIELRPQPPMIDVTVTLRSGRVESWSHSPVGGDYR